jgi:hypothetical protein
VTRSELDNEACRQVLPLGITRGSMLVPVYGRTFTGRTETLVNRGLPERSVIAFLPYPSLSIA